jgi:acetylornithine aminotransferase/acetylornithine/N-succinyldiaminopimelate aminotransferase
MTLSATVNAEAKLLLQSYDRQPVLFTRGKGVHLWDDTGRRYLDFLSGIGVNSLGHAHPAVLKAMERQSRRMIHISNLYYHEYQSKLAKVLTQASRLDRVFFCNSGTEAWEGVLKIARAYGQSKCADTSGSAKTGKSRIVALEGSFHGRTFGSLSTTGQAKYRAPFEPMLPGVTFVAFNDVEDLERNFDASVCAVCVETIQGEGGIRLVSPQFLARARELTERNGALLILDEIQCGLGRTGRFFAFQHYGIKPDLVTIAKPLAAGLPLGAILATNEAASCIHPGMHGTTFGGGPLACAVALEVMRLTKSLLGHVRVLGRYFRQQLQGLAKKHTSIREVRGLGLMLALDLDETEKAKAVAQHLLRERILINRTHETVLRFLPPFIIERKHVDQVIHALDAALGACASGLEAPAIGSPKFTARRSRNQK